MTLAECIDRVGEREYQTWMAHFEAEWNIPDRHDWYMMQLACRIAQVMNTKANQITPDMFKLEFKMEKETPVEEGGLTMGQITESVKNMWFSRTGYKSKD